MNNLTGLIPILYAALQIVSRELVGMIPATSRNMTANGAATGQVIRVPVTPETTNIDITPGTAPATPGTQFGFVDMMITKNRIAQPITWTGDEEISVGGSLNQMLINQYAQAMRSLVNEVEIDVCTEAALGAASAGNVWGTAGVTPFATNLSDLARVKKIMDDRGTPMSDRHLIINTTVGAALRSLEKLTRVNEAGENDMLRRGVIHDLMGYAIRESAGFQTVNPGAGTTFTISAAATAGSTSIAISGLDGDLNKGAIIMIAGNYYAVLADVASTGTIINISPALVEDIASGATGTVISAFLPSVAFSRDFIYLATRTPAMPRQGDDAKDVTTITDPVSGLSFQVALYGAYRQSRIEIGLAWGQKAVNKRHGCLLLG